MVAGVARGIVVTQAGEGHPLLRDRPRTWDAPAMHATIVDRRPAGMTVLAASSGTPVEAAEIRHGHGLFWGVQYHPEVALAEIADAVRDGSDDLIEQGLARDRSAVDRYATDLETLDRDPDRRDIAWQTGLGVEVTDAARRTREIVNFLRHLSDR